MIFEFTASEVDEIRLGLMLNIQNLLVEKNRLGTSKSSDTIDSAINLCYSALDKINNSKSI